MTMEKKEPRWSVTYTIHLDDKNGKTWGTLYYASSAGSSKSAIIARHVELAQELMNSFQRGQRYMLAFGPGADGGPTNDSDFGVFCGVKAYQFSVNDLWENSADE